jgi:hypothetical protein
LARRRHTLFFLTPSFPLQNAGRFSLFRFFKSAGIVFIRIVMALPRVYFDMAANGQPLGRIIMEVRPCLMPPLGNSPVLTFQQLVLVKTFRSFFMPMNKNYHKRFVNSSIFSRLSSSPITHVFAWEQLD